MASAEVPSPQFVTQGEVELLTATEDDEFFEPGTVYWEAQLKWADGPDAYVASWERSEGYWESEEEAKAHFTDAGIIEAYEASRACTISRVRDIAVGAASYEEFRAMSGVESDTWTLSPETWQEINAECGVPAEKLGEWKWEHTPSEFDEETATTTVRIPYDVMGPGEHELFAAAHGYGYGPLGTEEPACRVHTWPDGGWAARGCLFEWRDSTTTVVTVPELPDSEPDDASEADSDGDSVADGQSAVPIAIAVGVVVLLAVAGAVIFMVAKRRRAIP